MKNSFYVSLCMLLVIEFFSLTILVLILYIKVCNFVVGLFFLELVEKFGVAPVYASFGSVSLLAAAFAHYFLVETKGRSLEEIERSLNTKA
jgi:hypothetical protein